MPAPVNRLLHGLPRSEAERLEALYEPMDLVAGQWLCHSGDAIHAVLFPHAGVVSLVGDVDGATIIELMMVGDEGLFGVAATLGSWVHDCGALVQADGGATRIDARRFVELLPECPTLLARVQRYTRGLLPQLSQTIVCNSFHSIEQRTARWVLTMTDRVHSNEIRMTQEFLAGMLGVQRSGVSHAASSLHDHGLIRYSRGMLEVLDRAGLERAACHCYARTEYLYR